MSIPKIEYVNRLVAFVDVMGFQGLLRNDPTSIQKLQSYYNVVIAHLDNKTKAFRDYHPGSDFQKLLVSDSIVLSIIYDGTQTEKLKKFANFINSVGLLQYRLAVDCDIWSRGAISSGSLYMNETMGIIVGQTFVDAFNMEKVASYPRIIVDPRVCADAKLNPRDFIEAVNSHRGFNAKLVKPGTSQRFGRTEFPFDAIQIDWFAHAFYGKENLKLFFDGLAQRMVGKQDLFYKSRTFARYLRESWDEAKANSGLTERLNEIDEKLMYFGF